MQNEYRISDFILDALKKMLLYLAFNGIGFVAYAFTVGHIVKDREVEIAAKNMNLCVYSAFMIFGFVGIMCLMAGKDIGRKTVLIEASRNDDFDSKAYYIENVLKRDILPFFVAGVVLLIPYAIFYAKFGFGYQYSIFVDRIFAANLLFIIPLGAFIGILVENLLMSGVYAAYLWRWQKNIIDDRMWLKDAPKQENVQLNKPKDNYKNY